MIFFLNMLKKLRLGKRLRESSYYPWRLGEGLGEGLGEWLGEKYSWGVRYSCSLGHLAPGEAGSGHPVRHVRQGRRHHTLQGGQLAQCPATNGF